MFLGLGIAMLLLSGSMLGIFSGIVNFFESLFHSKSAFVHYPSQLTIYFNNPHQFAIGIANYTVVNRTNTTVQLNNGFYSFYIGAVSMYGNEAKLKLYAYNLTIVNTSAAIAVKANNSVQWLNIGNGTFSIALSKVLLNQS